MHKIDRYGVIALVFMAVTFLTVYFWDDHGKTRSSGKVDAKGDSTRLASRPESKPPAPDHSAAGEKRGNVLPLSASDPTALHASAREGSLRADPSKKATDSMPHPMPAELDEPIKGESDPAAANADADRRVADGRESDTMNVERPGDRRSTGREAVELASAGASGAQRPLEEGQVRAPESPATSPARTYTVAKGDTL